MNENFAFLNPLQSELAAAVPTKKAEPKPEDAMSMWKSMKGGLSYHESRDNPNAVGKSQDVGLFQITPIAIDNANDVMNRNKGQSKEKKNYVTYFNHSEMKDPTKNEEVARVLWEENYRRYVETFGKAPSRDDMIRMHNRPSFWKNDDTKAAAEKYLDAYNLSMAKRPIKLIPISGKKEEPKKK